MPRVDPRIKVGVIVHAISKIVLDNHTAKNIYGNVNYAKTFTQGTIVNVFNGPVLRGKNEQHDNQHNNQHDNQHDNQHRTLVGTTKLPACGACGWINTWNSPLRQCRKGAGGNTRIFPKVQLHQLSRNHICHLQSQPPTRQKNKINYQKENDGGKEDGRSVAAAASRQR
jgi:hypothetical protein